MKPEDCAPLIHVTLNMIVKDETQTIIRLLDSVEPIVDDYLIVDTGSSDGTPDLLKSRGISVQHKPFVDFGTNRDHALQLAKTRITSRERENDSYILLLDADMVLHIEDKDALLSKLSCEQPDVVYIFQRLGSLLYSNVRMIRAGLDDVKCVGVTHECYSYPSSAKVSKMPESVVWIEDVGDGGSKADKFQRDRRLLEAAERTPRNTFYLAQTYRDLGWHDLALQTYLDRTTQGEWVEEVIYSHYMLVKLHLYVREDPEEARKQAEIIRQCGCLRPEPFYHLCVYYRQRNDIPEATKYLVVAQMSLENASRNAPLFYETDVADYLLPFEEFMLWYHIHPKDRTQVQDLTHRLLSNPKLPDHLQSCVQCNYSKHYTSQ